MLVRPERGTIGVTGSLANLLCAAREGDAGIRAR
jgi:hypothetical protein